MPCGLAPESIHVGPFMLQEFQAGVLGLQSMGHRASARIDENAIELLLKMDANIKLRAATPP